MRANGQKQTRLKCKETGKQRDYSQSFLNCLPRVKDRKPTDLPTAEGNVSGNSRAYTAKANILIGKKTKVEMNVKLTFTEDSRENDKKMLSTFQG